MENDAVRAKHTWKLEPHHSAYSQLSCDTAFPAGRGLGTGSVGTLLLTFFSLR
jgi:hypothetical protein